MSSAEAFALTVESTREYRRQVDEAAAFLRDRLSTVPSRALILDADLVGEARTSASGAAWSTAGIPHCPGDEQIVLRQGDWGETSVLWLDGRLSLADGYTPRETVFPVRMLAELGVEQFLLAGTAGSLTEAVAPGDLVGIADHINFQGANPLVGPNVEDWGPRFPDMTQPYDPALRRAAAAAARDRGRSLRKGVYLATLSPDWGTRAEARMARRLGADVVGTGLVPEVIAARHMDRSVFALAVATRRLGASGAADAAGPGPPAALDAARPRVRAVLEGVLSA